MQQYLKFLIMKYHFFVLVLFLLSHNSFSQSEITTEEIKNHISFLTSEDKAGRYPGGRINKKLVKYIISDFKKSGIKSLQGGYKQRFEARLRVEENEPKKEPVDTWNVIGFIEGNDPNLKNEFIVLGAHYDHLGLGGPSSKSAKKIRYIMVQMTMPVVHQRFSR